MYNIKDDISQLTNIPTSLIQKLIDKVGYCICYDIKESLRDKQNQLVIDIGIGTLAISVENDIKYKFIPSKDLEKNIVSSVRNDTDVLTNAIEESLKSRILSTYKELL